MLKLKTGSNTGSDTLTRDPTRPDPVKIADAMIRDPDSRFHVWTDMTTETRHTRSVGLPIATIANSTVCCAAHNAAESCNGETRGIITKTSYDFSQDYLKLDHTSVVSSRLKDTIPYDLSYDYRKLIRKK